MDGCKDVNHVVFESAWKFLVVVCVNYLAFDVFANFQGLFFGVFSVLPCYTYGFRKVYLHNFFLVSAGWKEFSQLHPPPSILIDIIFIDD